MNGIAIDNHSRVVESEGAALVVALRSLRDIEKQHDRTEQLTRDKTGQRTEDKTIANQ